MISVPLGTRYYKNKSLPASRQTLENMYTEILDSGGKSRTILHMKPGKTSTYSVGNGPIRGMRVMGSLLYVVSANTLYSVNTAGTATSLGTIPGAGRVGMQVNLTSQLTIVNGTSTGYVYDTTNGLQSTAISYPAYTVDHSDGYMVFEDSSSENWFISSNSDATVFDSTETGGTNDKGDKTVAVAKIQNRVIVVCEKSVEGFYVVPSLDFPFQKDRGVVFDKGAISRNSVAKIDNILFFLGSDKEVYMMSGLQFRKITDGGLAYAIQTMTTINDARGVCFNFEGQTFYQLTFPTENKTFVFHVENQLWYQWGQWSNGTLIREKTDSYEFFNNQHIMGDMSTNDIYVISSDVYDDDGDTIRWATYLPPIHNGHERFSIGQIKIDCEVGIGLSTGQGSDPQIFLGRSATGRDPWHERAASVGKIGEFGHQVIFNRNGSAQNALYLYLAGSDPVKWTIYGVDIDG